MGKRTPRALRSKSRSEAPTDLAHEDLSQSASGPTHKFPIESILEKAEALIEEYNYEMAQRFCQRALEMDADNVRALELSASLLLEVGELDRAKQCLARAVTLMPHSGHEKFLSLAQLLEGEQSLRLYEQGLQILEQARPECKKDISSAYCAIGDLFMTDLCDESDAEAKCQAAIDKAMSADESNPEAWQTKARFLLITNQFEEARHALKHSLSLWLPSFEAILENREEAAGNFDPVEVCPLLYNTRIAAAKMLIELEEWDLGAKVLDGLLEEDDEVVETWYLLGWLNRLRATLEQQESQEGEGAVATDAAVLADGYNSNARFYLEQALKVHTSVKMTEDEEMVVHIRELLEEIGPVSEDDVLEQAGDDDDDDDDDDDEQNWETDAEEEESQMDQN